MNDYSNIDKHKFWEDFKEKHSKHEPLELAGPLEAHNFYSASNIQHKDICDILTQSAKEFNVNDTQIDKKELSIHIIHNKYLRLSIEYDFEQPKYFVIRDREDAPPFKTKIIMNVGETVLATKIAVQFMKKIQEKHKDCMFHYVKNSNIWRHEITDIVLDPTIFDSEKWEHIYNELGVSIHLPEEN